jgi:hypothetical protein
VNFKMYNASHFNFLLALVRVHTLEQT